MELLIHGKRNGFPERLNKFIKTPSLKSFPDEMAEWLKFMKDVLPSESAYANYGDGETLNVGEHS